MQAWHQLTPENSSVANGDRYGRELPDIHDDYCHLPEYLHQIGTAEQGFNGLTPLTFQEIEAWCRMTNAELTGFEAGAIRSMSAAYCAIAGDKGSDCPIQDGEIHEAVSVANVSSWMASAK